MPTFTAADAGRSLTVNAKEEISIELQENRTAGYQWAVESVTGELTLISSNFEAPGEGKAGASGQRTIVLKSGGPGTGEVHLRYHRSWEKAAGSGQQSRFTFVVKSA